MANKPLTHSIVGAIIYGLAVMGGPSYSFTENDEVCIRYSEDARTIMSLRQNIESIANVLELMAEGSRSADYPELVKQLAYDAYEEHDQMPKDQRGVETHIFATKAMLNCLAAFDTAEKTK